jgi:hypothetical protein
MDESDYVAIPVYTNAQREIHIFDLRVPATAQERETWILAGVAAFLA